MSDRSASEIEREVEAKRRDVEATLDALRSKLTASHILENVASSFWSAGGHGNELMTNLGRQIKENPLPVAITGVGLAWLFMKRNRAEQAEQMAATPPTEPPVPAAFDQENYAADVAEHGAEHAVKALMAGSFDLPGTGSASASGLDEAKMDADEALHGPAYVLERLKAGDYKVRRAPTSARQAIYDRARLAADEVRYGAAYVSNQLQAGAYQVSDAAGEVYTQARQAAQGAARSAGQASRKMQRGTVDFITEEPLLAGALGIALGAAIGVLLPSSRQEDEFLGPHRDKLRDDAFAYAAEQAERLRGEMTGDEPSTPPPHSGPAAQGGPSEG